MSDLYFESISTSFYFPESRPNMPSGSGDDDKTPSPCKGANGRREYVRKEASPTETPETPGGVQDLPVSAAPVGWRPRKSIGLRLWSDGFPLTPSPSSACFRIRVHCNLQCYVQPDKCYLTPPFRRCSLLLHTFSNRCALSFVLSYGVVQLGLSKTTIRKLLQRRHE